MGYTFFEMSVCALCVYILSIAFAHIMQNRVNSFTWTNSIAAFYMAFVCYNQSETKTKNNSMKWHNITQNGMEQMLFTISAP